MKKTLLFILSFLFLTSFVSAQFWTENFSTGTEYSVTLGAEGEDGSSDYFIRTDDDTGHNIGPSYTGINGFFFAGQDIDDSGWGGSANPSELTWSDIDISGQTNLEFRGKFASVATAGIDNSDYLHVQYNIDSGGWTNLIWFENDGTQYNTYFIEDTDFSGDGEGTQLTSTFVEFTKSISSTGSLLSLRITCAANSGGEDFAFDDFQLSSAGGNSLPSITNIVHTPDSDITSSTTVSVSADVTDSDGTITNVELHWGLASGSLGTTISMSNGGSGDTFTTTSDIPAQSDGVTVYYEVEATDDEPESTTSAEYNYTVFDAQSTAIPYSETFDSNLGDCYTYSVSGATKEWIWNSGGYALMNGYDSGDTEEDWLIIPAINFNSYSNEVMTFDSWYNFGTENGTNYLKLFYSPDYSGLGDPTGSTWTELTYTQPSSSSTWTGSGDIDLSGISGTSVYIGFKYHYEDGNYRSWELDNFDISEVEGPSITNVISSPANPNSSQTVSVSADVTDTDGISSVELHWGITSGSLGTTISMSNGGSGDTYTTSSDIPAQTDGTTVYYEVYAVDNNTNPTTSSEFSYLVSDAAGPAAGIVFISEVSDEDAGGYTTAYMEIFNNSAFAINMENSYIERWSSTGSYDGYTYTFGSGVTIPADGVLLVARGADQSTFETAWGISISSLNASFDQGHASLYFTTGRSYKLFSQSSRDEIDTTPVVDSGNRIVQTSVGTWSSQESSSNATPGVLDSGQVLPVTLTDFSTAIIMNEFVQISWTTQSESSINVWNLYRETDDSAGQVLINSQPGTNTSQPFTYIFEDHEVEEDITYYYYLEVTEYDGSSNMWGPISAILEGSVTPELPTTSQLESNYPNPFNPSTTIKCDIKEGEEGELTIYNSRGQAVERQILSAGEHIIEWDGTPYGSGVYLYKLETNSYIKTRKMIMIK